MFCIFGGLGYSLSIDAEKSGNKISELDAEKSANKDLNLEPTQNVPEWFSTLMPLVKTYKYSVGTGLFLLLILFPALFLFQFTSVP